MKARYTLIEGEVIAQKRNGVRHLLVPDTQGSTVALMGSSSTITDTFEYWPYGELRTRTGSTTMPFQYIGALGYYRDSSGRTYVRARVDRTDLGTWMTVDQLVPGLAPYSYARANPTSNVDEWGMKPSSPHCFGSHRRLWNDYVVDFCRDCYRRNDWNCIQQCSALAEMYYAACQKRPRQRSGQIWVIVPGVGVVPGPRPNPVPSGPTIQPYTGPQLNCPRGNSILWEPWDCRRKWGHPSPGAQLIHDWTTLESCLECCENGFPNDEAARLQCRRNCSAAYVGHDGPHNHPPHTEEEDYRPPLNGNTEPPRPNVDIRPSPVLRR
ncbi:MAG: hypothetical protein K1X67_01620 [Fimbriimonadaceae bacterium]|nr:hypothetical protein [Fimbriimonadaceae bacterium]